MRCETCKRLLPPESVRAPQSVIDAGQQVMSEQPAPAEDSGEVDDEPDVPEDECFTSDMLRKIAGHLRSGNMKCVSGELDTTEWIQALYARANILEARRRVTPSLAGEVEQKYAKLRAACVKAGFSIMETSGDWRQEEPLAYLVGNFNTTMADYQVFTNRTDARDHADDQEELAEAAGESQDWLVYPLYAGHEFALAALAAHAVVEKPERPPMLLGRPAREGHARWFMRTKGLHRNSWTAGCLNGAEATIACESEHFGDVDRDVSDARAIELYDADMSRQPQGGATE